MFTLSTLTVTLNFSCVVHIGSSISAHWDYILQFECTENSSRQIRIDPLLWYLGVDAHPHTNNNRSGIPGNLSHATGGDFLQYTGHLLRLYLHALRLNNNHANLYIVFCVPYFGGSDSLLANLPPLYLTDSNFMCVCMLKPSNHGYQDHVLT